MNNEEVNYMRKIAGTPTQVNKGNHEERTINRKKTKCMVVSKRKQLKNQKNQN